MAGKRKRTASRFDGSNNDKFHQLDFNDRERAEVEAFISGGDFDLSSFCVKLCEAGWKVSFSYSEYYRRYYGSLTDKRPDSDYEGHTFTCRYGDFDGLIGLLHYVYKTCLVDGQFRVSTRNNDGLW